MREIGTLYLYTYYVCMKTGFSDLNRSVLIMKIFNKLCVPPELK